MAPSVTILRSSRTKYPPGVSTAPLTTTVGGAVPYPKPVHTVPRMDTTPAELLEHAANLYAQGRFSMTLDPLQFAWRDLHGPDTPLVESTYMRASEAISATAGVPHEPGLWFTVFSRRNADQVAALLKQSVALAGLPELDQGDVIEGEVE